MTEQAPRFSRENIDKILSVIPHKARCCYTGQSILAYCPDPTFSWEEVESWTDETDVDIFVYSRPGLAAVTQAFMSAGWEPFDQAIDGFKAERIRFFDSPKKFTLQTVALKKEGLPRVNLTWFHEAIDVVSTIKRFDMDYLMVGLDIRTGKYVDLRGKNHRVANVNVLSNKFDIEDVDVMFWLRQFDRVPKGYARGIDTRPVARTYLQWLDETIEKGDWSAGSKTRFYANRKMEQVIDGVVEAGFTREQAESLYHLVRREDQTWDALRMNLEEIRNTISEWLDSVSED